MKILDDVTAHTKQDALSTAVAASIFGSSSWVLRLSERTLGMSKSLLLPTDAILLRSVTTILNKKPIL